MIVIVENVKIRIFKGAKVGDALLRFLVRKRLPINNIQLIEVTDKWGHILDCEAPLHDKQIIKIKNL